MGLKRFVLGATALAGAPGAALASGFAVEHQNAEAQGAAYAGAQAKAGDAGFAAYNPAAFAGIDGLELSANVTTLFGKTSYENASATLLGAFPAGGLAEDNGVLPVAVVPASAFAFPVSDRLTLGLTVTSPFGLRSEYDVASAARYYAQDAELLTIAAAPTAAFEVTDRIAVGASLRIQYADLTVSQVVDAGGVAFLNSIPGFAPASSDLFAEFKADDLAIGFLAGAQIEPVDGLRIGLSYASKIEHDFDGEATFDIAGSPAAPILNGAVGLFANTGFTSTLRLPASYSLGASAEVSERMTLLATVALTKWSVFDQFVLDFANPAQPPEIITAEWDDSWTFAIGGEYQASDATAFRLGFSYDETPVTDEFAAPRIPDTDRRWLNAGLSHAFTDRLTIDLAAGLNVAPKTREVRLDGTAPGDALRGALSADVNVNTYTVSLRSHFRF
jgi:long-chain fatty acid transport protein